MPAKYNHTRMSVFILVPAIAFMIYITVRYWTDPEGWAQSALYWELIPGVIGLIGYQLLKEEPAFPTQFSPISDDFLTHFGIPLTVDAVVQMLIRINMSITSLEKAFYVAFAAPLEEIFHRAFVITGIVMLLSLISKKHVTVWKVVAVIISSVIFTAFHFSNYGNLRAMLATLGVGLVLGTTFVIWEDITANIVAHFLANMAVAMVDINDMASWFIVIVVFAAIISISFLGGKKKSKVIVRKITVRQAPRYKGKMR